LLSLHSVASPSLLIHGGVGLDRIRGHARTLRVFVGSAVLTGHRSYRDHDGGAVLVGLQWFGAPIQEGLPLVFLADILPVCAWHCSLIYAALASPVSALT
jgi:hypothetical protein